MTDERLNLPSASSIERIALCPGSRALELTVPDTRTTEAELGDEAHKLAARYFIELAKLDTRQLPWPPMPAFMYAGMDINIADVVERFIDMTQEVYSRWLRQTDAKPTVIVEERIFWNDDKFNPITSGQPDILWISGKRALIPDLKSLNGDQTESTRNLQLRTYAVLVHEEHGCTEIDVAICQPRMSREPQVASYELAAIEDSKVEILAYLNESAKPNAPLRAGVKQCKFCRARAVCPAAAKFAGCTPPAPDRPLARGEAQAITALLSVPERIALWEKGKTVIRILEAVTENLKALPDAVLAEHGLEVLTQQGDRVIVDGPAAFEAVKDIIPSEDWNTCCTVGITKLENLFRTKTEFPVKKTKEELAKRLGLALSRKDDSRVLARRKDGAIPPQQPTLELNAPAANQ